MVEGTTHPRRVRRPLTADVAAWNSTIAADLMAQEGRALSLWGDAGWGHMVREDKYKASLPQGPALLLDDMVDSHTVFHGAGQVRLRGGCAQLLSE